MSRRLPEAAAGTGCLRHRRSDTILAIRGALYPLSDNPYWLASVQLLDGIGAGIFGALFLLAVADLTHGTGHFNISQGEGATTTGLGGALSTAVACLIIERGVSVPRSDRRRRLDRILCDDAGDVAKAGDQP